MKKILDPKTPKPKKISAIKSQIFDMENYINVFFPFMKFWIYKLEFFGFWGFRI